MNWQDLQKRFDEITAQLTTAELSGSDRIALQKEHARLSTLLSKHTEIQELQKTVEQTTQLSGQNTDPEMATLYQEELDELQAHKNQLQEELDAALFPPDEQDDRSAFIEIRAGAGGQEAALFAGNLLRMYTNYALKKGWRTTIVSASETDLKGFKEVILHVQGKGPYGHFKHDSGVHRVQRVPATETSGRVHTSTATVAVLPEAQEVDVFIDPNDLRIDVYRAGGAGGQHVNTTDSAVRITHIPTGTVVTCQDERSQHKNKNKAMKVLKSRILANQKAKQEQELSKERKKQVGTGMRAEKVRTYNYPQNRVTDHQVNLTLKKLDMVMEGEIDEIIDALRAQERDNRKAWLTS